LAEQALLQQKIITEVTIQAQEKERNELGRELHDNINQVLATVKMFLGIGMENTIKGDEMMKRSVNNVNYAIEEIRKLSRSLVSPSLGDNGLIQALHELVDEANLNENLKVELDASLPDQKKLEKDMELMIYRIAQEQLTNIRKYAKATRAVIRISTEGDNLIFSISDDGIGFDTQQKVMGIGLKNIRSRVDFYSGTLLLGSSTTSPYSFVWNNVAVGNYSLTAKAIDANGVSTQSGLVNVTVLPQSSNTTPASKTNSAANSVLNLAKGGTILTLFCPDGHSPAIYSSLEKVADDLPAGDPNTFVWDGKNKEGRTVASGVYLYKCHDGSHGKLLVIK